MTGLCHEYQPCRLETAYDRHIVSKALPYDLDF